MHKLILKQLKKYKIEYMIVFIFYIINVIFALLEPVIFGRILDSIINNVGRIDFETKNSILQKVKGLIFHKIGSFVVLGSDNIIISTFLGVATVGLYSNYNTILQAVNNLFNQVFSSITASVGNLLVEKKNDESYQIYKKMLFINSWMYSFSAIAILGLMEPFIKLWIGKQYLLNYGVLIMLTINFYVQGMRKTPNTFKEAAGIFHEDRFIPIVESAVNIIASILFLKLWGLVGVFMGTVISSLVLFL